MQSFEEIFFLIEMMGFGFAIVLTCVFAGQIYLRYKEPDIPRPIKVTRKLYKQKKILVHIASKFYNIRIHLIYLILCLSRKGCYKL